MHSPTLIPKVIDSYRVTFDDSLMKTINTYYFGSLEEVSEAMKHIDLERYSVTVGKVKHGDEYVSEWMEPKQGQHYKMVMVNRGVHCCSKSFFMCSKPNAPVAWFMVLLYTQPKGQMSSAAIEIRQVNTDGTLSNGEPIVYTTLPHIAQEDLTDETKDKILNWYIDNFVKLHCPEDLDIEELKKTREEQQSDHDSADQEPHKCRCGHCKH